jgi:MerR family transcriptional regulator, light-induced transcriptional regulator
VPETVGRSEYSIAAVSKLTGVSCHALRVWERRYGYPMPQRSQTGHRRYSPEQVHVLSRVAQLMHSGHSIGSLIADLRACRLEVESETQTHDEVASFVHTSELVDRLLAGDLAGAEASYQGLTHSLGPVKVVSGVIEPALIDIGERWYRGECQMCQDRCASGFLRRKLEHLFDVAQRDNVRPRHAALIGTVQGDRHEGGVLILALLLELAGWRSLVLGVDLPVREYQEAIKLWRPDALALSFVLSRNINKRFQELEQISGLPIFVGGRSILNYQGLARRHGLLPLPGPASQSVSLFLSQFDDWVQSHAHDAAQK